MSLNLFLQVAFKSTPENRQCLTKGMCSIKMRRMSQDRPKIILAIFKQKTTCSVKKVCSECESLFE